MEWLSGLKFFYDSVLRHVFDIALLAFIIFQGYKILVKTQAVQLVKGLAFVAALYGAAFILKLDTLSWILNLVAPGVIIALAILFQPELRKMMMRIGQGSWFRGAGKPRVTQLEVVLNAAEMLSSQKRGALIVFPRKVSLKNIVDTGTRLGADLSSSLILTVFSFDTPLHDGAMVVQNGLVLAAGCLLPLSEQQDIKRSFGTRHRAALGLSEEADAIVLVVSEETGAISLAYDSKLYYNLAPRVVHRRLQELLDFPTEAAVAEEPTVES